MAELEVLRNIADMVEKELTDDDFDMVIWQSECGTVGCAFGHAVKRGLVSRVVIDDAGEEPCPVHITSGMRGLCAAAEALNLTVEEAAELFLPSRYRALSVTRNQVVARIRRFIKERA